MKIKVLIAGVLVLISGCLLINGLVNEEKQHQETITTTNEVETTTSSTTTTKKVKTTKKVVKTTKKVTTQKVATSSRSEYESYAKTYGNYDDKQMNCLIQLWNHESGWNPNNVNKRSGACGIPQALPCSKIKKVEGSNDWKAQIRWGIKYINYRYKNPCGAWKHFQSKHWY